MDFDDGDSGDSLGKFRSVDTEGLREPKGGVGDDVEVAEESVVHVACCFLITVQR